MGVGMVTVSEWTKRGMCFDLRWLGFYRLGIGWGWRAKRVGDEAHLTCAQARLECRLTVPGPDWAGLLTGCLQVGVLV
jgi:hypothetical protein